MAWSKRGRIALGCAVAAVVAVIVLGGGATWWIHRWDQRALQSRAVRSHAAAMPFAAPADGLIPEERLRKFLELCRRERTVEDTHKASLKRLRTANERDEVDLGGLAGSMAYIEALQEERAKAAVDLGLGARESRWIRLRIGESRFPAPQDLAVGRAEAAPGDEANARLLERHRDALLACLDVPELRANLGGLRAEVGRDQAQGARPATAATAGAP